MPKQPNPTVRMANPLGVSKDSASKPLPSGVKKLTYNEMMDMRSKWLCFNCDEKFTAGHICKNKKNFLTTTEDEVVTVREDEEHAIIWEDEEECNRWGIIGQEKGQGADLSLHAISGTQSLHIVRLPVTIKVRKVSILLDSGSSHSFISQDLVKEIKWSVSKCTNALVIVANVDKLSCNKVVENVKWLMSDRAFSYNFNVIPRGMI